MRAVILALAGVGLAVVLALVFSWRGEEPLPQLPSASRVSERGKARPRAGKVQERLGHLREDYRQRKLGGETKRELRRREGPSRQAPAVPAELAAKPELVEGIDEEEIDEEEREELLELRDTILGDPDPDERVGAILMLSGSDDPQAIDTLVEALEDEDDEVRLAAVEALGDYSETLEPEVLIPALEDSDPEVRFEALGIIGDMEKPRALVLVQGALDDPDEDVRALAQGILDYSDEEVH